MSDDKSNVVPIPMRRRRREDTDEPVLAREMLKGLISNDQYIEWAEPFWRSDLLDVKPVQIVSRWCFDFFHKYKRAPGSDIESYFEEHRDNLDYDTAEQIELVLKSLSDEYQRRDQALNVEYLLDQTKEYFRRQAMQKYKDELTVLLDRGEIDKAEALAKPQMGFNDEPEVITGCEVERREVEWLMQDVIPRGYLTLLAGPKNAGKTLFLEWAAARMSKGDKWRIVPGRGRTGDTLLLTVEDDAPNMIMPRFDAAGGDDRRIHIVQGITTRDKDGESFVDVWDVKNLRKLEEWLDRYPRVRLIVIDPVGDFMPTAKPGVTSAYQHVRRALSPLAKLAAKRGIAVVLTTHLRKGHEGTAVEKIIDSTGFTTLARMVLVIAPHPDEPDQRGVLAVAATNLVPRPWPAFEYHIDSVEVRGSLQPMLVFGGKSDVTADELLAKPKSADERALHEEIQEWLIETIKEAGGSAPVKQVFEVGKEHKYSEGQIRTAARRIGIKKPRKKGFKPSQWVFDLPSKMRPDAEDDAEDAST